VTLQRKPVDLTAWHLTDQAEMVAALTALKSDGWRGAITYDDGSDVWRLELNADNPTRQVIAQLGDWLILDIGLRKLSDAECADNYDEVSP
jgi:hypothetical protein